MPLHLIHWLVSVVSSNQFFSNYYHAGHFPALEDTSVIYVLPVHGRRYDFRHGFLSITIYNSLCLPYLQYCAIIWDGSNNSILKDILTIQKRAVGSICQRKARSHWDSLVKILGVMKIINVYTHQVSNFIYKYNTNMLPINFINYFTKKVQPFMLVTVGVPITSLYLLPILH